MNPIDRILIPRRVNVEVDAHGRMIAVSDSWIEDVDTGDEDREPISDRDAYMMMCDAAHAALAMRQSDIIEKYADERFALMEAFSRKAYRP